MTARENIHECKKGGYAHNEVHLGLEAARRKPTDTIYLILYRLDDCKVPGRLQEWHYVSDFQPGDFEKMLAACEQRRKWLNTNLGANIEPLHALADPASAGGALPTPSHQAASGERRGETFPRQYASHTSWVLNVAWEPHGTRIASAGADGTVHIWEAATGTSLLTYRGHTSPLNTVNLPVKIYTVAWSPDGQRVASAGDGAQVAIWSAKNGQTLARYEGHAGAWSSISTLAWSPDGRQIASSDGGVARQKTIHIWNTQTGQTLSCYQAGSSFLPDFSSSAVAWSPDGQWLATACGDKTARIWETATEKLVATYPFRAKWASNLAWSPRALSRGVELFFCLG